MIHKVYFCPIFQYFFKKGFCCSNLFLSIRDIEITTENEIATIVPQFKIKKRFPFPWLVVSKYFLTHVVERAEINHLQASIFRFIDHNCSLDFVTFTIPQEMVKHVIYFFYSNFPYQREPTVFPATQKRPNVFSFFVVIQP